MSDAAHGARTEDYAPPEAPEDNPWYVLGLKVALAMTAGYLLARLCGFESPTWTVLTAAFLATSPPIDSGRAAVKKAVALAVGVSLGAAGAYATQLLPQFPYLHIAVVGFVAGVLGSRSPDYLFAAVVGTVVTFVGSSGGDPLPEVVVQTTCMVLIGCAVGPATVWLVERVRARRAERRA